MTPAASMPKVRILYVDDDIENLNSFKAVFRRIYDVHLAVSAQEALDILRETDIQVLITDQRMPGMTGTELLERAAAKYPDILRYMLTGFSDFDPLVDAINKGKLLGYFSKPIDHEFIKSRIEEGLKRHYLEVKNQSLLEEIRQSEIFLAAIIENIPDMIFVKDAENLSYVRFNRAGETLVGCPVEEMIGKTDYDLFSMEEADFFTRKDREALETKRLTDIPEESIQTRFKGKRWLHTKKSRSWMPTVIPCICWECPGILPNTAKCWKMRKNWKRSFARLRRCKPSVPLPAVLPMISTIF